GHWDARSRAIHECHALERRSAIDVNLVWRSERGVGWREDHPRALAARLVERGRDAEGEGRGCGGLRRRRWGRFRLEDLNARETEDTDPRWAQGEHDDADDE